MLLCLAAASGGLAASEVSTRARAIEEQVGPLVPVVVARGDVPKGARLDSGRGRRLLAVRRVPARFAPRDSLASPAELTGARVAVAVPAGGYITVGMLDSGESERPGSTLAPGERAVEVPVSAGPPGLVEPGARVDVVVTTEPRAGAGRTFVALEGVEVLGVRAAGAESEPAAEGRPAATAYATLRTTVRQAVFLTAAQNFAREVRLLARAPGDRRRGGGLALDAGALGG